MNIPLRLDIAGSFTDLPVYREKGGAHVTFPLDYHIRIIKSSQGSSDYINEINCAVSEKLNVTKMGLDFLCDLQHGAGLGVSSATIVAIIKFYIEHYAINLSPNAVAATTVAITEATGVVCGRQDEYSAAFGMPLYLQYWGNHLTSRVIKISKDFRSEIEKWCLVYRTRSMSCQDMLKHEIKMNYSTKEIVKLTSEIYNAIGNDDFERFLTAYLEHWNLVEKLNIYKINNDIRELRKQFPNTFIRPCGAGAGGYILIHDDVCIDESIKVKLFTKPQGKPQVNRRNVLTGGL